MPFEIAPKTKEQQRQILGRIALGAIADYILTIPPERFDMQRWCGTACCAIGHGVSLPEVRATGLHLVRDTCGHPVQTHWPKFDGASIGTDSVASAFGLSYEVANALFGEDLRRSPEEVSGDIRHYLARSA